MFFFIIHRTTQPPIIIPKNITTKIVNNETVYEHVYTDDVQGKQKFGVRQALRQGEGEMTSSWNIHEISWNAELCGMSDVYILVHVTQMTSSYNRFR